MRCSSPFEVECPDTIDNLSGFSDFLGSVVLSIKEQYYSALAFAVRYSTTIKRHVHPCVGEKVEQRNRVLNRVRSREQID